LCARVPNIDVVFDDVRVDFYIPVGHVRGSRIKMNLPQVELAGLSVQGENIKVAQPTVSNAAEFVMIPFGDILEIKLQPVS